MGTLVLSKMNKFGESVRITKDAVEGKIVYTLNVDNGNFKYSSSKLKDCIAYAHLN